MMLSVVGSGLVDVAGLFMEVYECGRAASVLWLVARGELLMRRRGVGMVPDSATMPVVFVVFSPH